MTTISRFTEWLHVTIITVVLWFVFCFLAFAMCYSFCFSDFSKPLGASDTKQGHGIGEYELSPLPSSLLFFVAAATWPGGSIPSAGLLMFCFLRKAGIKHSRLSGTHGIRHFLL